jgi:26S proteasome regulatory subunit N10
MPHTSVVIYDNALSSQNQDYFPSRYVLQKEVIERLITHTLEGNAQSLIGLIPIAQKDNNDILTPTLVRPHLSTFLHRKDLYSECKHNLALYQAEMSLETSEFTEKNILMILGSPISESDQFMMNIYALAAKNINIRVVCFGDACEFGEYLAQGSNFDNLKVLNVYPEDDFNHKVFEMFSNVSGSQYVDKDLEEAIRRSMIEK